MSKTLKRLFLLLILASLVPVYAAKLYKWVDQDGSVTYRDRVPTEEIDEGDYQIEEKDIRTGSGAEYGLGATMRRFKFPVTLYSANTCASCDLARDYLKKRGIPFKEKNVQSSQGLADELTRISGELRVPVITVGDKVIKGFAQRWLDSELGQAGYLKSGKIKAGAQTAESEEEEEEEKTETE